jgi:hypothetical protein
VPAQFLPVHQPDDPPADVDERVLLVLDWRSTHRPNVVHGDHQHHTAPTAGGLHLPLLLRERQRLSADDRQLRRHPHRRPPERHRSDSHGECGDLLWPKRESTRISTPSCVVRPSLVRPPDPGDGDVADGCPGDGLRQPDHCDPQRHDLGHLPFHRKRADLPTTWRWAWSCPPCTGQFGRQRTTPHKP